MGPDTSMHKCPIADATDLPYKLWTTSKLPEQLAMGAEQVGLCIFF